MSPDTDRIPVPTNGHHPPLAADLAPAVAGGVAPASAPDADRSDAEIKVAAGPSVEINVTPTQLARQIDVPPNRICQIIQGKRAISGDTALRLARWFGTRPERWLKLQVAYEIRLAERSSGPSIRRSPTRTRFGPANRA